MLQSLREKTSGWVAAVILGLLIIPFAFFGVEEYFARSQDTYAARVSAPPTWWSSAPSFWPVSMLWSRRDITTDEFRAAFEQERQRRQQMMGPAFDAKAFDTAENKRQVMDQLIDRTVLMLQAERSNLAVSNAQVRDAIAAIPAFHTPDGRFDPMLYRTALASVVPAQTPRQFEASVRADLQRGLLASTVAQSAFATNAETDRMLRLRDETRDVSLLVLPQTAVVPSTDAARIKRWYEQHLARYRAPESVTIEYVDLKAAEMTVPPMDEAALRALYEQKKATFGGGEQRLASHILISVPQGADAATVSAAQAKATALAAQAKAPGADFAALARANSGDSGSKASGGDLGWVQKGVMVKPFEDALFAMQAGQVSAPVRSDFGFHIIQLREVKGAQQPTFEEMRTQLATQYETEEREKRFNAAIGKVVDAVLRNPTTLATAARENGLTVQTVGPIARGGGEGIAAHPAVQRAIFSETLVQDHTVSDAIEIEPGHSVLVRVLTHQPERQLPLADVQARVAMDLAQDDAAKAQIAAADALLVRLRAGSATLAALAGEGAGTLQTLPALQRNAPVPDPDANKAIFGAAMPAAGARTYGRTRLADGRIAVFAVDKVTPGNPASADPQSRAGLRSQIIQIEGAADAIDLIKALRRGMKIEVVEARF